MVLGPPALLCRPPPGGISLKCPRAAWMKPPRGSCSPPSPPSLSLLSKPTAWAGLGLDRCVPLPRIVPPSLPSDPHSPGRCPALSSASDGEPAHHIGRLEAGLIYKERRCLSRRDCWTLCSPNWGPKVSDEWFSLPR